MPREIWRTDITMPDLDAWQRPAPGQPYEPYPGRWSAGATCGYAAPLFPSATVAHAALTAHCETAHPAAWSLAADVQAYAQAHYADGGWDVIVECWTREAITESLAGDGCADMADALERSTLTACVSVWDDQQADARNSAF